MGDEEHPREQMVTRGVVGREMAPTTGTPHLQGYVGFSRRRTRASAVKVLGGHCHVEAMRASEVDAWRESMKGGDIALVKREIADAANRDKRRARDREWVERARSRDERARKRIADTKRLPMDEFIDKHANEWLIRRGPIERLILDNQADEAEIWGGCLWRKNVWIWGETGTGKSLLASKQEPIKFTYRTNAHKWWDGFKSEKHKLVIIDDFPQQDGFIMARYVKIWCDRYPLTGEVKGSSITVVPGEFRIVVTSNFPLAVL
jgi:hypothetical protein